MVYVGRAVDIARRFYMHKYRLNKNECVPNPHLQAAWNKYGESEFVFSIVQECAEADLVDVEQKIIDNYDPSLLYNKNLIVDESNSGLKRTDEQRARMSAAQKIASTTDRNGKISATLKGKKITEEQRARHLLALKKKQKQVILSDGQVFENQVVFSKACGYSHPAGVASAIYAGSTYDQIARRRGVMK